ncbi:MAG TPA: CAP domain-containing protein [Stenomitos sp.]
MALSRLKALVPLLLALHLVGGSPAPVLAAAPHWEVLPGRVETSKASPAKLEQDMLALVNRERRSRGLVALRWDDRLAAMGRAHSRDILARNYFAHEDPEGRSAADRAAQAGVSYTILGENLAFAPNLRIAHQGLMKSPGHRANILRPQFRRLGIGIVKVPAGSDFYPNGPERQLPVGSYGGYLVVTQVFAK